MGPNWTPLLRLIFLHGHGNIFAFPKHRVPVHTKQAQLLLQGGLRDGQEEAFHDSFVRLLMPKQFTGWCNAGKSVRVKKGTLFLWVSCTPNDVGEIEWIVGSNRTTLKMTVKQQLSMGSRNNWVATCCHVFCF